MDGFLDAPFPAVREQAPDLIEFVDIPAEEIVFPQDGRFNQLRELGFPVLRVFGPVVENPDEYLMRRYEPVEELNDQWEIFTGNDYLGMQQHLQEEWDAPEQVEDMDSDEEDSDDEGKPMDCPKTSTQDVDATSSASQHVSKRDDSLTDDDRLLRDIGPSSSSVATISLQEKAMPGDSPAVFAPALEPVTNSEVQKLNIDQVDGLGARQFREREDL